MEEYSDKQLEVELHKRKTKKVSPKMLEKPDFSALQKLVKQHVKSIIDGSYHEDNDDIHYMFEASLEAVYGKSIWKWYNKNAGN